MAAVSSPFYLRVLTLFLSECGGWKCISSNPIERHPLAAFAKMQMGK